jgi:hypothetical protein
MEVNMRLLMVVCALWAVLALPAKGESYVVRPDGTGDFPTIQAAIDSVVDGDIIELANGVFQGDGNWDIRWTGKEVTLRSRSGNPYVCFLDGGGLFGTAHWGIYMENVGPEALIEDLTILNAHGGIMLLDSSPRIERCVLLDNEASEGGGLLINGWSSPVVVGCTFSGNRALEGGGVCI